MVVNSVGFSFSCLLLCFGSVIWWLHDYGLFVSLVVCYWWFVCVLCSSLVGCFAYGGWFTDCELLYRIGLLVGLVVCYCALFVDAY